MLKNIIKGRKANSNVEIFNNRSVNDLMPSLVHLSDETCRDALKSVCGKDFDSQKVLSTKDVCEALNMNELTVRDVLYGDASEILRRHMVQTKSRVNLWTPRSVVILATILHYRSEACRGISMKVASHCAIKAPKAEKHLDAEVLPAPVLAKIDAQPVPAEAHAIPEPAKAPKPNEISMVIRPGTIMRVVAAF